MTSDEADDRYGSASEHHRERLVKLGWSEIIGRYDTPVSGQNGRHRTEKVGHEINTFSRPISYRIV